MLSYMLRRAVYAVPLILAIAFVAFVVITLPPGDFMSALQAQLTAVGGLTTAEAEEIAHQLRVHYGLDQPFLVQFGVWFTGIFRGDFGWSFRYRRPVFDVIWERIGWTLLITGVAMFLSLIIGAFAGVYSAVHQYGLADSLLSLFCFWGLSIPNFFFALAMVYLLVFHTDVASVGGLFSRDMALQPWGWAKFVDFMKHFWLPVFIIGTAGLARSMRVMRANLLDTLRSPYITTARSKGLRERSVVYRHGVRNALNPLVMYVGMDFPRLLQAEMATGIVLSLPTTGTMFLRALRDQDMYLAGSFILLLAGVTVVSNILADCALCAVDPRIRYD